MPTEIETRAQKDAQANRNMMDDPNWTAVDRQKYQAAYNQAKNKTDGK